MLKAGVLGSLIILVTSLALMLLSIWYQRGGKRISIRKLAGLDAIEEAVGRATEMGRPVHFSTGTQATLYGEEAPQILAGLTVLGYISRLTAKHRTPLIVTVAHPSSLPLAEGIVKESYLKEGHPEDFRPDMVRYISTEQQGYVAGVQGIFRREKVAANIMIGPAYSDLHSILETGYRVGAIQIAGTGTKTLQLPYIIAICDHALIGEEIYAAGAYISREPDLLATMLAQDISKYGVLGLFIIGTILTLFSKSFLSLLNM